MGIYTEDEQKHAELISSSQKQDCERTENRTKQEWIFMKGLQRPERDTLWEDSRQLRN